jgi:hypothetical protein
VTPPEQSKEPACIKNSVAHNAAEKTNVISFPPATAKRGDAPMLTFALGSVQVIIVDNDGKYCTFEYTLDIEQGYKTYRCRVPVSDPNVTIELTDDPGNIKTSFRLDQCEVVRVGCPWFWYRDVKAGTGVALREAGKFRMRYSAYADEKFTRRVEGVPADQFLEADLDPKKLGGAACGVLEDLKVGGVRQAAMSKNEASGISRTIPEAEGDGWLYVEIELLSVK